MINLKFLFPLTAFAGSLVLQCGSAAVSYAPISDLLFVLWTLAYLPTVSFLYARRIRFGGRKSIPYTLAHSFLHALAFFLFYFSRQGAITALVLFAWCELWALIGLIRKQKMRLPINRLLYRK